MNTPHSQKSAQALQADAHSIKEDLRAIKDDSITLAKDLKHDGIEAAKSVSNDVKDKVGDLKAQAATQLKGLEQEVKTRPLQSMAIAFAAGALTSILLGRR
jgi:ElaB/YqjD/DUF883 family membrane-anchored ribosome-binding protein